MKKKMVMIIIVAVLLINSLGIFGEAQPMITNVELSGNSNYEGSTTAINIDVDTAYTISNSHINAELVNSYGTSLNPAIVSNMSGIDNNNATLRLTIPGYLKAGEYSIKVVLYSYMNYQNYTSIKNIKYTINTRNSQEEENVSNPTIDDIITSNAVLVEGSLDGTLTITGSNFSTDSSKNIINIIDGISKEGIINGITPLESTKTVIKFSVPLSLAQGTYKIKLVVDGKTVISNISFTVQVKSPVISSISFSEDVNLSYGKISGEVIVDGYNLWEENGDNNYYILNENKEIVESITDYTSADTRITFKIPANLPVGRYYLKVVVDAATVVEELFEVSSGAISNPIITDIDTSNVVLVEGNISGVITIEGQNFLPDPMIEFIDTMNNVTGGSIVSFSNQKIVAVLPGGLKAGKYRVKVVVANQYFVSTEEFMIDKEQPGEQNEEETNQGILYDEVEYEEIIIDGDDVLDIGDNGESYTVNENSVKEIIESNGYLAGNNNDKNIVVSINVPEAIDDKAITFDEETISYFIGNNSGIDVITDLGTIMVPLELLKIYRNNPFSVKIEKLDSSSTQKLVQNNKSIINRSLVGNAISIEIKDSNNNSINKFEKNIKISTKVNIKDPNDAEKLCLFYYDDKTGKWVFIGGKYDQENHEIYAYVDHLTKFAVFKYEMKFKDIANGYWGEKYIEALAARNIINGMDENYFRPEMEINRAQFVTLLVKALNIKINSYGNIFIDVKKNDWFRPYVEAAEISGIISGVGNGKFDPYGKITREQMAVIIINAYKYVNGGKIIEPEGNVNIKDINKISSWALSAVKSAYKLGLITGMENYSYGPKLSSKRVQAATVLYKLLKSMGMF